MHTPCFSWFLPARPPLPHLSKVEVGRGHTWVPDESEVLRPAMLYRQLNSTGNIRHILISGLGSKLNIQTKVLSTGNLQQEVFAESKPRPMKTLSHHCRDSKRPCMEVPDCERR